jgi:general secretion pathway protein K
VIGLEFSHSMRMEALAVRTFKETTIARHLADAAVALAAREIFADYGYVGLGEDGEVTFFTRTGLPFPRPARTNVPFGPGAISYRLFDEQGRLNINAVRRDRLERLLQELRLEKADRDVILDSIEDWRDANEEHRVNGAESEDTYLKLPVPYRSHNANLLSTTELLQIKGVTPAIFYGANDNPPLADFVTVKATGAQVNINTAPPAVLRAIGLSAAEVQEIEQIRRERVYTNTARFGGQGFTVRSQTFRIEAEGLVDGRSLARLTVIVQKRATTRGLALTILEWQS